MKLSCTCSKFKILEKNNVVFCIVPALCFRNLIQFYVGLGCCFFLLLTFFYCLVLFPVCEFTDPSDVFSLGHCMVH